MVRRVFQEEEKKTAVLAVVLGSKTIKEVCAELNVLPTQIKSWKNKLNGSIFTLSDKEVNSLQLKNSTLREENTALKSENSQFRKLYLDLLLKYRQLEEQLITQPKSSHLPYPLFKKNPQAIKPLEKRQIEPFQTPLPQTSITEFQKGEPKAVQEIYIFIKARVSQYLSKYTCDPWDIESAVDDLFFDIWRKRTSFASVSEIWKYAALVKMNYSHSIEVNQMRKKEVARRLTAHFSAPGNQVDNSHEEWEMTTDLYFHISKLQYPYKDLIIILLEHQPYNEIITRLHISWSLLASRRQHAINLLRKRMNISFPQNKHYPKNS